MAVFLLLLILALIRPADAGWFFSTMMELAEESDVVFVGEVTTVRGDTATVEVTEVLLGKLAMKSVKVTPVWIQPCSIASINFAEGETALIFGNIGEDGRITVTDKGLGKFGLKPDKAAMEIRAARRIIRIAPLPEDKKNEAMLSMARSLNRRLRSESHYYITIKLSGSKLANRYKDDFISLINDIDPEVQAAGLSGLRFIQAPEAIARMVELTRSENINVVRAASMALEKYDTEESVAALLALMKSEDPEIRGRASIDVCSSRRPGVKEALKLILYDKNPHVRASAPRRFINWLRYHEADDAIPRLAEMLNDSIPEVRASAAGALAEGRNPEVLPPLILKFKKEPQDKKMESKLFLALSRHYSEGNAETRKLIDEQIPIIIEALKAGDQKDLYGISSHAVSILKHSDKPEAKQALEWAAKSHPKEWIRGYAKRCLEKR